MAQAEARTYSTWDVILAFQRPGDASLCVTAGSTSYQLLAPPYPLYIGCCHR